MKTYHDLVFGNATIGDHADIYPNGDGQPGERWAFISTHRTRKKAVQVSVEVGGGRIESYLNGHYRKGWTVLKFCRYVPAQEPKPEPVRVKTPTPAGQLELFPA